MEVSFGAGSRPGAGLRTRGISCNHRDIQKAFPHELGDDKILPVLKYHCWRDKRAYSEARGIRRRYRNVRANLNVPAVNTTAAEQWYPLRNSLHTYMVLHSCVGHIMEMGPINDKKDNRKLKNLNTKFNI
ncbi:hypothetical protein BCR32DRAFT_283542 [Anaeromyces robustus]|uniref:Uncharacterized protein n=1 Tax=Anaeromyces robustus TaxID=1754192 RepID=A0A1Y1WUA0_9FUNG|nr:hypothetical protein BCR32DRAFT_283542 [Anaeromyces robustus]|eukprot:ORX77093.1 hypothetical protein BCR32DRAFT_283542 [Anaeromyces robustus]